ncbi:MAG: CapA family protein [Bacillota bacterium]|jgi:poly-gamma-glutamate capsule biosynthesis protein CapA/YwtB (metallophosphatase superfamily)|nr:CapA family protein [Clostridia bacterium]
MKKIGRVFFSAFILALIFNVVSWFVTESSVPEDGSSGDEFPVMTPVQEEPEITLAAVGDVMLARKLSKLMESKGLDYPFTKTAGLLASADIAFANLESPFSHRGQQLPGKGIWFRAKPENMQALTQAGFDVLSIANNHALDYDSPAFLDTIDLLNEQSIKAVGGGANIDEARTPAMLEVNGMKTAFLAYSEMADMFWSYKYPRRLKADVDTPGIAPCVPEQIEEDIALVRPIADLVVLSLHWGLEYQSEPEDYQREMAHRLIDAGADIIIGHHPHCIQGIETYQNGLIAYSLGNFVFDQNWSEETKQGLLLQIKCGPQGWQEAKVLPVYINDGQPVIAEESVADRILSLTRQISEKLDTEILIEGKTGLLINNWQGAKDEKI